MDKRVITLTWQQQETLRLIMNLAEMFRLGIADARMGKGHVFHSDWQPPMSFPAMFTNLKALLPKCVSSCLVAIYGSRIDVYFLAVEEMLLGRPLAEWPVEERLEVESGELEELLLEMSRQAMFQLTHPLPFPAAGQRQ